MREYIQNLDHCPFCKEKFMVVPLKKYYRSVCPNKHNLSSSFGAWCYKKSEFDLNHSLCIRMAVDNSIKVYKKNHIMVIFEVLKRKNRTKIYNYKEDNELMYAPTIDLRFDKFLNFDLSNEENFKQKLNTILLFS